MFNNSSPQTITISICPAQASKTMRNMGDEHFVLSRFCMFPSMFNCFELLTFSEITRTDTFLPSPQQVRVGRNMGGDHIHVHPLIVLQCIAPNNILDALLV